MDLYFKDFQIEMDNHFTENGWTRVCDEEMFCGLISPMNTLNAMAHFDWDLLYFESTPVVEMAVTPHYARYGSTQCEALVRDCREKM